MAAHSRTYYAVRAIVRALAIGAFLLIIHIPGSLI